MNLRFLDRLRPTDETAVKTRFDRLMGEAQSLMVTLYFDYVNIQKQDATINHDLMSGLLQVLRQELILDEQSGNIEQLIAHSDQYLALLKSYLEYLRKAHKYLAESAEQYEKDGLVNWQANTKELKDNAAKELQRLGAEIEAVTEQLSTLKNV